MSSLNDPPQFRSGLRRLLYPAVNPQPGRETGSRELLEALFQRLQVDANADQALPLVRRTLEGGFVDVTSGAVILETTDVELPGPVPFRWTRHWRSEALTSGSLGHGWRHAYDVALLEDRRTRQVVVRLPDNRAVVFPLLAEGEQFFHRTEKLRLSREAQGYQLRGRERTVYHFTDSSGSVCRLAAVATPGMPYRLRFSYTPAGHLRRISDDFQRVIEVVTDAQGRISRLEVNLSEQSPQRSLLVGYQYDEHGDLRDVTGPDGRLAQYIYRNHRLIRLTNRFRNTVYFSYEADGNEQRCNQIKKDDGLILHLRFQLTEGLTQVTDAAGGMKQYVHEGGIVQRFISAGGRQKVWFFNEYGDLLSEQDALGNTAFFAYDEASRPTQAVWPDGSTLQMQYDANGQLTGLTDRAGGSWLWTYDREGRLLSCANPVGATTDFTYRDDGQLQQVKRFNGQRIQYDYNSNAQLVGQGIEGSTSWEKVSQVDIPALALTNQHPSTALQATYDADGQLIRLRRGTRLNWQFIRDAAGRVSEYTNPDGQSTRFHYDAAGRVTEVLFGDGSWYHYTYRPDGQLIEAATPTTLIQFERDPIGRILTETGPHAVVQNQYDERGYRLSLESSAQARVQNQYSDSGQLTGQQHSLWAVGFAHDRQGRLTERQMPGGLRSRWQYDSGHLPTHHQLFWGSGLIAARSQKYGWAGQQLVQLQDLRFGAVQLRYDTGNKPIEAVCSTGWTDRWVAERSSYQRRLLKPAADGTDQGWQVITVGTLRFYYDADGYLREKRGSGGQVWQFRWHPGGVLLEVLGPRGAVVTFQYDALGRRIEKQQGESRVRWAWDGPRLLHEWHQRPGSDPVPLTWYTAEGSAEPTRLQVGDQWYSLVCNYLGQPLSLHNQHGEPVWEWGWALFGKNHQANGPAHWHSYVGRGQYEDREVGLIYADFRYLDAETGLPLSPEYSSPAGWARSGWEPPHEPESYLSAARYIRAY